MAIDTTQLNHDLETLRIERPLEQSRRRRNPLVWPAILVVGAAIAASVGYVLNSRTLGKPQAVQTMMVETKRSGQASVLLTGSGYIVTRHKYIIIGTKILGQIVEEPIEEGQRVNTGDLLARIDDRDYQAQLRQAIAIRDVAEANLRLNLAKAARARNLNGTGAISTDDFETAVNAAEVAQAGLKRDEAAIDYARFLVDQCVIKSPIDGIVLKKYRELGDTINYGGQVQAGGGATDIAQLADTKDMRAEVDINEADIAKVDLGTPAKVVPDAYAGRSFEASLVKVYPEADRQKGTVKVEVQIEDPDLRVIKPELSVKVSFLERKSETPEEPRILVPKTAISTGTTGACVWVVRDGVARRTGVVTGITNESSVEVNQGLKDGDVIIVAPSPNLAEGQKVAGEPGSAVIVPAK